MSVKFIKHVLSVLTMLILAILSMGSFASGPKPEPKFVPLPITYKEAPLSELKTATAAAGTGFIVEGYVGSYGRPSKFKIVDYKYNDKLEFKENKDLEEKSSWIEASIHPNGKTNYDYSIPQQFEIYSEEDLYNRVERGKKYKIYIGSYAMRAIYNSIDWKFYIDKIEGLATLEEMQEKIKVYSESRAEAFVYTSEHSYKMVDWKKAFSNKENAVEWIKEIISRDEDVRSIVSARRQVYDRTEKAFKYMPNRLSKDALLKDKNNLIEAYNRYNPIISDIEKIIAKGVSIENGQKISSRSLSPWGSIDERSVLIFPNSQKALKTEIDRINAAYAKIIDTYPVD